MRCLTAVTRLLGRRPRRGPGEDARPFHGHPAEPLAALSDPRLPRVGALGVLPGERRLRLSRPASGRDGAGVSRPALAREHLLRAAGAPVRRGRRAALVAAADRARGFARGSPTTACGCRMRRPTMSRSPAISRSSTRRCRFSKGRLCTTASTNRSFSRWSPSSALPCSSIARGRSTESLGRRPRSATDGHRRLERWHERVGEGGKGESVWLGWFLHTDARGVRDVRGRSRRARRALRPGGSTRRFANRSSAKDGTAIGTGAAISTTERRWVRPRTANAESIRSRSRGA